MHQMQAHRSGDLASHGVASHRTVIRKMDVLLLQVAIVVGQGRRAAAAAKN